MYDQALADTLRELEAAKAEVAQVRQERDDLKLTVRAWIEAEDKIIEALGPRDRDILQRIHQLVAGEAALDHLRARLQPYLHHKMECAANGYCDICRNRRPLTDECISSRTHGRHPFKPRPCNCGLADLLAVLTEP